jgi:hypothetical protein
LEKRMFQIVYGQQGSGARIDIPNPITDGMRGQ